jgi:hypothetical protein
VLNPFSIGVTLGGLLLDVVAPRPKPRPGCEYEPSLLSPRGDSPTPRRATIDIEQYDRPTVASGYGS